MGVLKVNVGDAVTPDWRKIGCGGTGGTTVTDDFNRADDASSVGGSGWTVTGRNLAAAAYTWGILSNRAYCTTANTVSGTIQEGLLLRTGVSADFDMSVTLGAEANSGFSAPRVMAFRADLAADDGANGLSYWLLTHTALIWVASNAGGTIITLLSQTLVVADVVRVVANGTAITVYRNGVSVGTATSPNNQTATAHGLAGLQPGRHHFKFDDFSLGPAVAAVPGRLKLWTGSGWAREKCDDGTALATDDFSGTGTLNGSTTTTGGLTWQSTQLRTYTMQPFTRTSGKITATSTGSLTVACSTLTLPADCTISATIAAASTTHYAGMVFRWVDASNFWLLFENVGKWYVYRFLAGAISSVLPSAPTAGVSDVVEIVMSGGSWTFRLNGTDVHTDTSGTHSAGTRHGVYQEDPYTPVLTSFTAAAIAHPLKMWDGTAWVTVARMVPV